ncbi:Crp/Fnr family transcriptional regulator [Flammeovirga kamogawensis]|uniref:Crp/Fnr family transcriptional regulator n=1 Tax=Flammeovirga kamogawensis TaxID=373891 RepID=A0ABX8H349_9BACT|nr:Crp/Fnr family transcriptional regulator [Flammeovirga kamogawensis]MBB6460262.1 signal-transduction protein with cAMP-binding, CBS, and nucleotidyltransferase domain [Flammeovirga kamogawensis]QWG10073.1 Crp/Fnr family transcriptional regulator [Flammeovirga kamogawensis]TRX65580.1 Crp/Fnr family transcriptional regulator [Flammeovirga kamogawensis]
MPKHQEYIPFLKKILDKYSSVSTESIQKLLNVSEVVSFDKEIEILRVGEVSKYNYFLIKGAVISCYLNKEGKLYHKNIFLENSNVGSKVSALTQSPSNFSLETIEPSTLLKIHYKEYKEIIDQNLDLKNFYLSYLETHWVIDKEKREIDIVLKDASDRYLEYIDQNPGIEKRIPLRYIASFLGITPTQLSRIRKKVHK